MTSWQGRGQNRKKREGLGWFMEVVGSGLLRSMVFSDGEAHGFSCRGGGLVVLGFWWLYWVGVAIK